MTKLLFFYLTSNSRHYTFSHFINFLESSEKKDDWELLILTHDEDINFYKNHFSGKDIKHNILKVESKENYLVKVKAAIQYAEQNNIPFVMKCDNDIFLPSKTLDYLVDNLELLNDDKHLTITPTLSSGIPGIEYFIRDFLDTDAKISIEKIFLDTVFHERDSVDYSVLNKHTVDSCKWDKDAFFDSVSKIDHYYKGIHPIRINNEAIFFLNNYIIENKERFLNNTNPLLIDKTDKSPYLCNSIFAIKTDTYKKIVYDQSLFVDWYEEVPLNKYSWNSGINHLFIRNGFAIHMYYNWTENHIEKEKEFVSKFFI